MHACSTLWPGVLADDLDMTRVQRAEHEKHRALHFERVVKHGAVLALFADRLARFKHPRRIVFVEQLPKNALGKVQQSELRKRL